MEGVASGGLLGGSFPSGWPLTSCRLGSLHYFRELRVIRPRSAAASMRNLYWSVRKLPDAAARVLRYFVMKVFIGLITPSLAPRASTESTV